MTLLPEVERALLDAVARDHERRRRMRLSTAARAPLALLIAAALGSGVALSTGAWPGAQSPTEGGGNLLAPTTGVSFPSGERTASLAPGRGQVVAVSLWASGCRPSRSASRLSLSVRDLDAC